MVFYRWGLRFPDMSSVYSFNQLPEKIEENEIKPVISGIVIGPVFCSNLTANFVTFAKCNVVSPGVGFDSLVIKHMGAHIELATVGVVTASAKVEAKPDKTSVKTKYPVICQAIQHFFSNN